VSNFDRYVSTSISAAERQKRFFFYAQDTFRLTPKLTLNYGLRWEDYSPESVNAKGNGGFANLQQGVIRVAGYGPYGLNGNVDATWDAFAPRLGIAYQLRPKTVIRMGYGRSFDMGVFGSNFGHGLRLHQRQLSNHRHTERISRVHTSSGAAGRCVPDDSIEWRTTSGRA
jgi:outer membrane receptor protein involved in Fe transport